MLNETFPPVKKLVYCSFLVAIAALLGGAGSVPVNLFGAYNLKIGFSVVPIFLAGIFFGPLWGGGVGMLADFLQAMAFPRGGYMPFFTLSNAFFGVIPGLFFLRQAKVRLLRLLLAIFTTQLFTSVLINTCIMVLAIGQPWEIVYARATTQAFMIPLHTGLCYMLIHSLQRAGVLVARK